MPLYRNAFWWFVALLAILMLGFWRSYFAQMGNSHGLHHFHGIAMLAWVLLLITQSWLVRNRKLDRHRAIGKLSFIVAPAVVVSGILVSLWSHATGKNPTADFSLGIFWFGLFSSLIFGWLYVMAIVHRKTMTLHARYMVLTALVFLIPGLSRSVGQYIAPLGVWTPDFYQMTYIPLLIGLWMLFKDWRGDQPLKPLAGFCVLWAINEVAWLVLPHFGPWQAFGAWVVERY